MNATRAPHRRRVLIAATGLLAIMLVGCSSPPAEPTATEAAIGFTRGPVPESARLPDGSIDLTRVPDFIPAAGDNGNVGWIWSVDVFPPPGEPPVDVVTVYADDLATVIGHMYPQVGFVPLGAEEEMLPDPHQNRELTIRVRNESDSAAILEITAARDEANWQPWLIAPPTVVEPGADREIVFRAPRDRWSVNLRGDPGFFYSDDLGRRAGDSAFSLVVGEDRVLRMAGRP